MALIPVFKDCSMEYLEENWEVEFPISDWVSIEFPYNVVEVLDKELDRGLFESGDSVDYETNRYDIRLRDRLTDKKISVYLYMDENSNKVIAIDEVVFDRGGNQATYPIEETPFAAMLEDIRSK